MVQMALQEVLCNGMKTENETNNGFAKKYDEEEEKIKINGKVENKQWDNSEMIENETVNIISAIDKELDLQQCEISATNHIDMLLDESTEVFSSSVLAYDLALVEGKFDELEKVPSEEVAEIVEKSTVAEKHDCLQHPTHFTLLNKLEASKNTISKLEEAIIKFEKQLSDSVDKNEQLSQLEQTIVQYQKEIDLCKQEQEIDQRTIASLKKEMETKLSSLKKQYETANKEKENMVMRYVVSEKELLDCKKKNENVEKKMKDLQKENESSLNKLKIVTSEKLMLSQQLDSKVSEISNTYKEIDKLKEEINSRDIKIKWTQNKLKNEMEDHKECSVIIERLNSIIKSLEGEIDKYKKEIVNMNLELGKFQSSDRNAVELPSKIISENQEIQKLFIMFTQNKTLQLEFQELLKENNLISHQIGNIEQIWLALDGKTLNNDETVSNDSIVADTNSSPKNESLMKLLKETEQILGEINQVRNANEKMLATISSCQTKGAQLLSLPPFVLTSINKHSPQKCAEDKNEKETADSNDDNQILIKQMKSRLEDLERQLVEEKIRHEDCMKIRTEEILTELERLRNTNEELMSDLAGVKSKEAELLAFTQKLTSQNVLLQSEFSAVESKAIELEMTEKNHADVEYRLKIDVNQLRKNLKEEKERRQEETRLLARQVAEKTAKAENLVENVNCLQNELSLMKNKYSVQIKELQKELSQYRRKIEQFEVTGSTANSLTSSTKSTTSSMSSLNDSPISQAIDVPAQVLVERIVKLQQESAKQNDRIEFLEDHSGQLVKELQKKSRLLQSYILREQTGTLTSNSMDRSKAELSKSGGIMASLYGSKPADETMTFEICLEINRKLQAVLEDTLLKNITLKENIDTLGDEIARLTQ